MLGIVYLELGVCCCNETELVATNEKNVLEDELAHE